MCRRLLLTALLAVTLVPARPCLADTIYECYNVTVHLPHGYEPYATVCRPPV